MSMCLGSCTIACTPCTAPKKASKRCFPCICLIIPRGSRSASKSESRCSSFDQRRLRVTGQHFGYGALVINHLHCLQLLRRDLCSFLPPPLVTSGRFLYTIPALHPLQSHSFIISPSLRCLPLLSLVLPSPTPSPCSLSGERATRNKLTMFLNSSVHHHRCQTCLRTPYNGQRAS